ncbi:MAG: cupin domain-containing protein [Bacteroidales bacterium]|nr:cupin domain-containing protein [Bacteroidales bacterium]
MKKVNISEKLNQIKDYWNPRVVAELNGQQIRLVKIIGDFTFHKHDNEDEMFWVIKGKLKLDFEDKTEEVNEGEFFVVPKGIVHRPVAEQEVHLLMFTAAENINTGDIKNEMTLDTENLEKI